MKKLAYALSVAVSLAALYQAGALYFARTTEPRESALSPPAPKVQEVSLLAEPKVTDPRSLSPAKEPFAGLPLDQAKAIDFTMDEGTRARLTRREQADQLRDWLLFTVVGDAGLSAEDVNRALYDVPALRHGYMRPVANFEYGPTRSCFIGNGRVIALLPAASQGAERKDLLAHVADDHRKNTGALPEKLLVFDYDLHLDALTATVTRRPEIDGASLFTAEHGYREASLHGLGDLKGFLAENRDLVYVTRRAGELVVGGRQGQAHIYRGIRPEDGAAIWQAQQKLHALWGDTEARFQREVDDFNARWRTKFANYNTLHQFDPPGTFRPSSPFGQGLSPAMRRALGMKDAPEPEMSELEKLQAERESEWKDLERRQNEETKRLHLVRDVGFSLDPTYDYKELGAWYDGFADKLAAFARAPGAPITENEVRQAREAIGKQDEFPMLGLIAKLRQSSNATAQEIGEAMQDWQLRHRFQCARYDGELQGTEVGMVLFYTDLVMKLWGFDYAHSTPGPHHDDPPAAPARADRIEDFSAKPEMLISPVYEEEMKRLPQTRQWLGPLDKGYQLTSGRDGLLFAPDATRIFGKSSTGSDRQEVPANVMSDNFITWWNDHYEEVARYEPEYERLNEVMKWSLVISWLTDAKQMDRLGFLNPYFPDNPRLSARHLRQNPGIPSVFDHSLPKRPRNPMGDSQTDALPVDFDHKIKLEFHGSTVTSDAGLLAYRELDDVLRLTSRAATGLHDTRTGQNAQHSLLALLRQAIYSRLAGYEDVNDAERLCLDPALRAVVGGRAKDHTAASTSEMARFETETLSTKENLKFLMDLSGQWIDQAHPHRKLTKLVLDMDSSVSETYGHQEGSAYNGHFVCTCYHPLFLFNQFGDLERVLLRRGNCASAKYWRRVLLPVIARYRNLDIPKCFRGDSAFAGPKLLHLLEREGCRYAIRLKTNAVLERKIAPLLKRPVGRPSHKPKVFYRSFRYQAGSWECARRVVVRVAWHAGELFPRVGFVVTNLTWHSKKVVHFYNRRGTAEQWIKEGKNAVKWTKLSCRRFKDNAARLQLFALAYNLANFLRQRVLPKPIQGWTLTTLREKLIKIGAKVVAHAKYVVFQLAEVAVPRQLFAAILNRIERLRLACASG